jgi:hypothetical protein
LTSFVAITNAQLTQDAAITQPVATAGWRDNLLAALETDTSAPFGAFSWQIEDGAGGTDPIWDQAVDGNVTTIETPVFASGWEYAISGHNMSLNITGGSAFIQGRITTASANSTALTVATTSNALEEFGFFIQVNSPMWSRELITATGVSAVNTGSGGVATALAYYFSHTSNTTVSKLKLSATAGRSYDAGKVYLLKRAEYAGR